MNEGEESLAEVLGGSSAFHDEVKPAAPVQRTEQQVEAKTEVQPETKSQARDESGKFAKTEVTTEQPATAKPEETMQPAHLAAVMDERRKRQASDQRAAQLEQELAQLRQPRQEQKPPPSVFEDEDGAISHRVEAATTPLRMHLLEQSVTIAKLLHKDDFAEAEEAFHEALTTNPHIAEQFRNASNPGEFVYQTGMYHREMSKYGGSVVAMRDAIRGESAEAIKAANARVTALEKELDDLKASHAEVAAIPASLNGRSSGAVTAETQTDDEPLGSIVRFGNKPG